MLKAAAARLTLFLYLQPGVLACGVVPLTLTVGFLHQLTHLDTHSLPGVLACGVVLPTVS